jgi:hypothetical protein
MNRLSKILTCGIAMSFVFSLISCSGGKISKDIVSYINQDLINISGLENLALTHYAAVTGDHYTSDQEVCAALKENVIPYYKRFLELLRAISPEDPELIRVHTLYIYGATDIYNGFKAKMIGLEGKDEALVLLANRQIESGARQVDQWRVALYQLIAQNKAVRLKDTE